MATKATKTASNAKSVSASPAEGPVTRERLIELLNEDLAREYQAIIAYVVYSQVIKGAQFMKIAKELEKHAGEELDHALTISKMVDYLGGTPTVIPEKVKMSEKPQELLQFDLDNETKTIREYRERVKQCEALGEFAISEHIRDILEDEQEHAIDLATASARTFRTWRLTPQLLASSCSCRGRCARFLSGRANGPRRRHQADADPSAPPCIAPQSTTS